MSRNRTEDPEEEKCFHQVPGSITSSTSKLSVLNLLYGL